MINELKSLEHQLFAGLFMVLAGYFTIAILKAREKVNPVAFILLLKWRALICMSAVAAVAMIYSGAILFIITVIRVIFLKLI